MSSENKDILRQEARRHRSRMNLGEEDIERVTDLFFEHINPAPDKIVAAYWPQGREFDPIPILERLSAQGNTCALPMVEEGRKILNFLPWKPDSEMIEGKYGIAVPKHDERTPYLAPSIVIVPLLAFDRRGYRLGQGGGYYDATLSYLRSRKSILAVGVAYAQQACLFNLPTQEHDEPLDWVITPSEAHYFE
jgi:5-formyltetrahydrofolate cyclo-ligase